MVLLPLWWVGLLKKKKDLPFSFLFVCGDCNTCCWSCGMVVVWYAGSRAILDSRQKALKLTANALYGFTGAMASPLQSVPLADGCLALGSQVTLPWHSLKACHVMYKFSTLLTSVWSPTPLSPASFRPPPNPLLPIPVLSWHVHHKE